MDLIFAFNTTDENDTPDSTWLLDYSFGDLVPEYGSEPISGNDYNAAFEGNDYHHNPIQPQVDITQRGPSHCIAGKTRRHCRRVCAIFLARNANILFLYVQNKL